MVRCRPGADWQHWCNGSKQSRNDSERQGNSNSARTKATYAASSIEQRPVLPSALNRWRSGEVAAYTESAVKRVLYMVVQLKSHIRRDEINNLPGGGGHSCPDPAYPVDPQGILGPRSVAVRDLRTAEARRAALVPEG
jgi:hypothetical protein